MRKEPGYQSKWGEQPVSSQLCSKVKVFALWSLHKPVSPLVSDNQIAFLKNYEVGDAYTKLTKKHSWLLVTSC